jgi:hypothetical protein
VEAAASSIHQGKHGTVQLDVSSYLSHTSYTRLCKTLRNPPRATKACKCAATGVIPRFRGEPAILKALLISPIASHRGAQNITPLFAEHSLVGHVCDNSPSRPARPVSARPGHPAMLVLSVSGRPLRRRRPGALAAAEPITRQGSSRRNDPRGLCAAEPSSIWSSGS